MQNIEMAILNPEALGGAERAMLFAARLTQRGHKIDNIQDIIELYQRSIDESVVENLCALPHATLQKFAVINIVVAGLSRRALAQITRHQNEVKFMAGSLQYSDYSGVQRYIIPEEIKTDETTRKSVEALYDTASQIYDRLIEYGVSPDAAGYVLPQGFRTCLLISATPYQWKHMISQRTCRRNTEEVAYIFRKAHHILYQYAPEMFEDCGPGCCFGPCPEKTMTCAEPYEKADYFMEVSGCK